MHWLYWVTFCGASKTYPVECEQHWRKLKVVHTHRTSCWQGWPRGCGTLNSSSQFWILTSFSVGSRFHSYLLGWFSNRTGTSFDDGKARGKDETRLAVPNLPHSHWSTQLFDLRAPSSTDVPVLLLNQPIYFSDGTDSCSHYMYTKNGTKPIRYVTLRLRDRRGAARRGSAQLRSVVTETAPLQPFLCMNRNPSSIQYDFRGGAKRVIQYSVNTALVIHR